MPGTDVKVDVCVCFSNNCNGKIVNETESSSGEMKLNAEVFYNVKKRLTVVTSKISSKNFAMKTNWPFN